MKIVVIKGESGKDIWEDVPLKRFGITKIIGEKIEAGQIGAKSEKNVSSTGCKTCGSCYANSFKKVDDGYVFFSKKGLGYYIKFFLFLTGILPKENPDIIIVKKPFPFTFFPAWIYAKMHKKKILMHYDEWEINKPFRSRLGMKNILLFVTTYISIFFADGFIIGNENLKKLIKSKKPFFYLPNGAIPWIIKPSRTSAPKGTLYALYIGGSYRKVQEPMYKLFESSKDMKLFVAGKVCDYKEVQGRKNIILLGKFDFKDLSKIASKAHVLLAAFDYHWHLNFTSNVKIFDYMCLEKPIIASAVGEIPKYLDYGKAGYLVKPGDMKELKRALGEVFSNYSSAIEKAKYARRLAETKYDRRNLIRKVLKEIKKVYA